ncbi:MAG: type II toxin-antitoxin system VapC family toxin [Cellulomonas sp.]|jgi:predicted nucleic acid-binding protein|nr:type II toxin-antitoxin system VapC family toxin [Cellulomonas sp.]
MPPAPLIVVDTTVVSETVRPEPDPAVTAWAASLAGPPLTTAVTVGELLRGVARLPDGIRRRRLRAAIDVVLAEFDPHQLLPYDVPAAHRFGDLTAAREAAGRPISVADAQIAAICLSRGATLATRNTRDFELLDLDVVNPWEFLSPDAPTADPA